MDITLRTATLADVDPLVELIIGGKLAGDDDGPEHRDAYLEALREIEDDPHSTVLVAVNHGVDVVGMLQMFTFRHVPHRGGRCAEIESMHVRHDLRYSGVGGKLLDHAIEIAREMGCYRVQLTSNDQRHNAHRFYERHGFVGSHRGFKRYLTGPDAS
jgi:GNAT superfamily N-acetyltransferase